MTPPYWPAEVHTTPHGTDFSPLLRPDPPSTGDFYFALPVRLVDGQVEEYDGVRQMLLARLRHFISSRTEDDRTYIIRVSPTINQRRWTGWENTDGYVVLQAHATVLLLDPSEARDGDVVHELGCMAFGPCYGHWSRELLHDGETWVRQYHAPRPPKE